MKGNNTWVKTPGQCACCCEQTNDIYTLQRTTSGRAASIAAYYRKEYPATWPVVAYVCQDCANAALGAVNVDEYYTFDDMVHYMIYAGVAQKGK